MEVLTWLLDSDPAIRWQVLRDLTGAPEQECSPSGLASRPRAGAPASSRCRVTTDSGTAAPTSRRGSRTPRRGPALDGDHLQPVACATSGSTLAATRLAADRAGPGEQPWEEGDQPFFDGEVEPCINGMAVALGAYFGENVDGRGRAPARRAARRWRLELRCRRGSRVRRSATTINVLEGLLAHERATGGSAGLARGSPAWRAVPARARAPPAQEHRRADRPGMAPVLVPDPLALRRAPRPRPLPGRRRRRRTSASPRRSSVLRSKRHPDGTWPLENTHPGRPISPWKAATDARAGGTPSGRCGY